MAARSCRRSSSRSRYTGAGKQGCGLAGLQGCDLEREQEGQGARPTNTQAQQSNWAPAWQAAATQAAAPPAHLLVPLVCHLDEAVGHLREVASIPRPQRLARRGVRVAGPRRRQDLQTHTGRQAGQQVECSHTGQVLQQHAPFEHAMHVQQRLLATQAHRRAGRQARERTSTGASTSQVSSLH
jgi:hypothetical protein